jgi:hypothetical protein
VASPDGRRLAYVQMADGARRLRVRPLSVSDSALRKGGRAGRAPPPLPDPDSIVVADRAPERPTWSPDGTRLAFYSAYAARAWIYVAPTAGTYVNAVALRRGVPPGHRMGALSSLPNAVPTSRATTATPIAASIAAPQSGSRRPHSSSLP